MPTNEMGDWLSINGEGLPLDPHPQKKQRRSNLIPIKLDERILFRHLSLVVDAAIHDPVNPGRTQEKFLWRR